MIPKMKTKKRYIVLKNRLRNLESDTSYFLSLTPTPSSQKQTIIESLHRQFEFLNALLAAEFASNPNSSRPHHHLHRIARRLSQLETAFRGSFQPNHLELPDHHAGDNDNDNDNKSTCSCTESCLNEEIDDSYYNDDGSENDNDDDDLRGSLPGECSSFDGGDRDLNDFLLRGDEHYYRKEDGSMMEKKRPGTMRHVEEEDGSGRSPCKIVFRKLVISFVSCVMIIGVLTLGFFHFLVMEGGDFVVIVPPT